MSSVPYTGSIVGNLSLSACLAATSAVSGLAFWYRNPDEGATPNQLHDFMDRSDILPGAALSTTIVAGGAAAVVFTNGVFIPSWEKGSAAAGRAYEWVTRYRCRADGAAAMAFVSAGLATGAARYVPPPYDLVAAGLSAVGGALYLYNKPDAIISPPPVSPSSVPDFDPSGAPMNIAPGNPLHLDAPYLIAYPSDRTIELRTPGAAFIAMMCKPDFVTRNASTFMNKSGETLMKAFESKTVAEKNRILNNEHVLTNPDKDKSARELMIHLLRNKFGIGVTNRSITKQQEEFRTALIVTEGNFRHPAFGTLLDSDTMTSLLQKCYKEINTEDDAAAEAAKRSRTASTGGVRFASTPSSLSSSSYSAPYSATRYPTSTRVDDGRGSTGWDG